MSEGDLSGMDKEVVEESVVAIDAVVASSNDGGVHGRRSGLPGGQTQVQSLQFILERAGTCQQSFFLAFSSLDASWARCSEHVLL